MSTIYLGTINGGGDGAVLLLAAINRAIGKNYTLENFGFGLPEPVTTPSPKYNTKIQFGPKDTTGAVGVRTVYYNRIHASDLGNVIVAWNNELRVTELLDRINEKYGILIKTTDIIDSVVPSPAAGTTNVKLDLVFSPSSIIFYSSTKIQIGLNDPTGDTVVQEPFNPYITTVFSQSQEFSLGGVDQVIMEPFSVAMDRDNTRIQMSVLARNLFQDNTTAASRVRLPVATFAAIKEQTPFVGMWKNPADNTTLGVTVLGDVYSLNQKGDTWSFLFNGLGYDTQKDAVVNAGYAVPYVKGVAQGSDGSIYVLAKPADGVPKIYKGAAAGTGWVALPSSTTRMMCLSASAWPTLQVLDILHSGDRLWVLQKNVQTYDIHPSKGRLTPAVEVFNTTNNTSDYFPLSELSSTYSEVLFRPNMASDRWRLVTPVAGAVDVDVVALLSTVKNNNTVAVYYRHQAVGEYTATILPHTALSADAQARGEMDIVAYQLPLASVKASVGGQAVAGHYLDVVEIHTAVEVSAFNRYFLRTASRTTQGFFSYGIRALVRMATRAATNAWNESNIPLTSSQKPVPVTLQGVGQRMHVSLQNGVAIHSLRFRQTLGSTVFSAEVDSSRKLEAHTGFDSVCRHGACVWVKPSVVEDGSVTAVLTAPSNTESGLAPIGFSFIGKAADGSKKWLVAQNPETVLIERIPSQNYAFMGKVPALIAAEGTQMLFWSAQNNGVFESQNNGGSWREYNNAPLFYKQERAPSAGQNIVGQAAVPVTSQNFLEGTLVAGKLSIEIKLADGVKLYDLNTGLTSQPATLSDGVLFLLGSSAVKNEYTGADKQAGYGLNALSQYSPRQILAWDTDKDNRYETIGRYTTAVAQPLAEKFNWDNYLYNVSGTLLDFSRDVRYLGFRHWILVDDGGVYKLHFTNGVMPERTINLFGSTDATLKNFKPEVSFHLWEHLDTAAGYVPYVFYGNGRVLLLDRPADGQDIKTFGVELRVLDIPNDNGAPLKTVKMYTANRRDYYFTQKGNGIFKLHYEYNGVTKLTTLLLQRVFDLSNSVQQTFEIESGCLTGIAAVNAPQEADIPTNLPLDYYIGWNCNTANKSKIHRRADGNGGYTETVEPKSLDCGYVPESEAGSGQGFAGGGA